MSLAWAYMLKEPYKKTTKEIWRYASDRLTYRNKGWDTRYNLVSTWEWEETILKKVRFEKDFTPYPHFIVYDFEAILAPLNQHSTDDLTYIKAHTNNRCYSWYIEQRACIFSWWKRGTFIWTINWGIDREARNNSCRCCEAAFISFRFSNVYRWGEK